MTKKNENKMGVAMVGYYNTLPFLHGMKKSDSFKLILDIPSKCMDYYNEGTVDIALVPVATLIDRTDYNIVTNYCIGCVGSVRTVCLFSNSKLSEITKIYLDKDSRTSQLLVKTLCKRSWKIQVIFEECDVRKIHPESLKPNEAILMIGDKVFEKEKAFEYNYDLGEEWQNMTGLPFTFAVWIARNHVNPSTIYKLNRELGLGVNDLDAVLIQNQELASKIDLSEYFKTYIDFNFDENKKEALRLFFEFNSEQVSVS